MNNQNTIDFEKILNVFIRRKKLFLFIFFITFFFGAAQISYKRIFEPKYKGSFSLLISNPIQSQDKSKNGIANPFDLAQLTGNNMNVDIETLKQLLTSPIVLNKLALKYDESPNSLKNKISITLGGDRKIAKGVLEISYIDESLSKVKNILNELSETYVNVAAVERRKQLQEGIEFINKQFPILKSKLEKYETELTNFREKFSIIDPTVEGLKNRNEITNSENLLRTMIEKEKNLFNLKNDIKTGNLSAIQFKQSFTFGGSPVSGGGGFTISDSNASRFNEIVSLEEQLAIARTKYKPSSLMITSLSNKIESSRDELIAIQMKAAEKAIKINKNQIDNLRKELELLKKNFNEKPKLIQEYNRIEQFVEISRTNLSDLISSREKFQIEISQQTSPWQILSPADVNSNPFEPNIPKGFILFILLGLINSVLITLLRDRLDNVYHTANEIADNTNETILGSIPYIKKFENIRNTKTSIINQLKELDEFDKDEKAEENYLKEKQYEKFLYQESFRNLYTSIRFLNIDNPLRKILITSSTPKEGKSLINIILAKTLADIGCKVLLIDADMRKPQVHERLGLNNILGLSNLLIDKKSELRKTVQNVKGIKNLDVLTSGRQVPDTTRLLRSERMKELIMEIDKEAYDYILFDPPPVLGLSDANLLSPLCDGTILIVSLENVNKKLPIESINKIKKTSSLLGLITNGSSKSIEENEANSQAYESYSAETNTDQVSDNLKSKNDEKTFFSKIFEKLKNILNWIDR